MRSDASGRVIDLRAITGTRVVLLAIAIASEARDGLLGFAIARISGNVVDWLEGRKVFASVVPHPNPQDRFPSNRHPIQSLIWSDYEAKPGTTTRYRVQPVYGTPSAPTLGESTEIEVTTEDPETGTHGIWFNRGAIASQAFSSRFQNKPPRDEDDPADPEVRWLARGALDAALGFIGKAEAGEGLRVAAYEFTYTPILLALKEAAARGVDVQIVHEAGQAYDSDDKRLEDTSATRSAREAIAQLELDRQPNLRLIRRTRRRKIPHNKFIVHVRAGSATQVLTGSTNFTASGFIGQTNVLHIVRDEGVAGAYLDYWTELSHDPSTPALSTWTQAHTPQDELDDLTGIPGVTPFFSPRKNDAMLSWYAERIAEARETVMFTAAFGVNKLLAAQFGIDRDFVRFLLLEDAPDRELRAKLRGDRDVLAAYGSLLGAYASGKKVFPETSLDEWFLKEELFRKQGHIFFLHTKFLLVDPLGDDPLVCTGSANFSTASLTGNDENMLLIRGDTRVADIYLTEFDRLFRHFYARQTIDRLAEAGRPLIEAKFLDETPGWLDDYVTPGRMKTNRQRLVLPELAEPLGASTCRSRIIPC
jgi:phosphatidylserine/phosphatidylglycerophosphate/cardiolipin synthase-like enzyme